MKTKTEVSHQESTLIQKKIKNLNHVIKNEFTYFQEENVRRIYIQMAYDFLMITRPTNVKSERAFSAAGLFCTKIGSQLGDQSLDKFYFCVLIC